MNENSVHNTNEKGFLTNEIGRILCRLQLGDIDELIRLYFAYRFSLCYLERGFIGDNRPN